MKREKKLLILVLCLVVVSLAAWGATKLFAPEENIVPMDGGDTIFTLGDAKTLSWTYEDTQYSFDISQEVWVNTQDETYTMAQLYQKDILDQLTDLKSQKSITDPGDPAEYGLAQPTCTITADDKTILIGDTTAVGNHLYLSVGDGKVYLVSETVLYPFRHTLEEMIAIPTLPDLSTATAITVTKETETLELSCDAQGNWFLHEADSQLPVSAETAASLIGNLSKVRLKSCVDVDLQAPETYGLDTPTATYQFSFPTESGEDTLILIQGDACSDGVYVMPDGSNRVYLINEVAGTYLGQLNKEALLSTGETEES